MPMATQCFDSTVTMVIDYQLNRNELIWMWSEDYFKGFRHGGREKEKEMYILYLSLFSID